MNNLNIINQSSAIILIISISLIFVFVGIYFSKKFKGLNNYLVANRSIGTLSLTTSLVASALGAWILFGPASAATWGGIGAVIGYSLGTAFPLFILIYLGKKFRTSYPQGKSIIEIIRLRFGPNLYKLILVFSIFYMTIFLIAEVTAVAFLINYISGTELWITSLIVISCSLLYTLYGGLRASLITDNIQFFVFTALLIISLLFITSIETNEFNFEIIKNNNPHLLSFSYLPNYTAGLTFFIAVAATNLFHQGNWQRVYAAKNYEVLKKSLIFSFLIILPIVFFMGFSGLVAVSQDTNVIPDLAFFSILLKENLIIFSVIVIILAISLTISSIDTLINAISSLVIVDVDKVLNIKNNHLNISKQFPSVPVDPYDYPWVSSHLKTWRASVMKKICNKNFQNLEGEWFIRGYDQALYLPILHIAKKIKHIDEICYLYRINSKSISVRDWNEKMQMDTVRLVRARGFINA